MTDHKQVYLDYAATTPVDERVIEVMIPYFNVVFGNTSSIHQFGQQAEAALESARETIAACLNAAPTELIFTSCGSESDNLALRGVALAARNERNADHILVSPVEHHAVTRTAQHLARYHGFEVEYLPVDQFGRVDPEHVADAIRPSTALVSAMYANNEIGTINPIPEIAEVCRQKQVPFHCDAVQAAAYLPLDVEKLKVDLLSLGAHKFYGPKGVGALYIRKETPILPVFTGGSQERGLRAGTHNVPYIVGMSEAMKIAQSEREARIQSIKPLQEYLMERILIEIPDSQLTGHPEERLPNHTSFVFKGADGNSMLMMLDIEGFACSSGSACKTGDPEPSEVLIALGLKPEWALGSLRVTLGTGNTMADIDAFLAILPSVVERARSK